MNILECDSVVLNYGLQKVLSSVYVKCQTGEIVGLLGRNGSGKSSLMRIIQGTQSSESKSVRINGNSQYGFFKDDISYLPQHHFIPTFLTLKEAFRIYRVSPECVTHTFEGFSKYLRMRPGELSGGVLRIFEIFLVAGLPSKFVLMDEPFSGIMPVHIEKLKSFIASLKIEKGVMLTDHLYRHIIEISDMVYVLANGKIYPVTSRDQLFRHGYVSSL